MRAASCSATASFSSMNEGAPRRKRSLVVADGPATRSLQAIMALLTFLAALAAGGAEIVARNSAEWSSAIAREGTVQLRPQPGRDIEADLARAAAIARSTAGIQSARPMSRKDAESLLEPWLGRGLDLGSLPVPRLVALKLDPEDRPDLPALAGRIAAEIPGATLDDHGAWLSRLSTAANAVVGVAVALVAVVLAAAGLAVAFATRGFMIGSRDVVDVLHLVGADEGFVAREFASRFLRLGLASAAVGVAAASLAMFVLGRLAEFSPSDLPGQDAETLFGTFTLGWRGYGLIASVAVAVAAIAGVVSGATAKRFFRDGA
jgi:cell division transport system permease protein